MSDEIKNDCVETLSVSFEQPNDGDAEYAARCRDLTECFAAEYGGTVINPNGNPLQFDIALTIDASKTTSRSALSETMRNLLSSSAAQCEVNIQEAYLVEPEVPINLAKVWKDGSGDTPLSRHAIAYSDTGGTG